MASRYCENISRYLFNIFTICRSSINYCASRFFLRCTAHSGTDSTVEHLLTLETESLSYALMLILFANQETHAAASRRNSINTFQQRARSLRRVSCGEDCLFCFAVLVENVIYRRIFEK